MNDNKDLTDIDKEVLGETKDDDELPDRDDMIESMEADFQHARNRRKGDDDLDMFD